MSDDQWGAALAVPTKINWSRNRIAKNDRGIRLVERRTFIMP